MAGSSEAEGFCVLRLTDERVDVSEVARLVAPMVGQVRFQVARQLRASRGIVARHVSRRAAEEIVAGLSGLGIDARMIPEAQVRPLPAAERVQQIALGPMGVYFGLDNERFTVPWEGVTLVLAARLGGPVEQVIRPTRDDTYYVAGVGGATGFSGGVRGNYANAFTWTTRRTVTHVVVDFYPTETWCRLRVEEGVVDFALTRDPHRPSTGNQFNQMGEQLAAWAGATYLSPGARLLGRRGARPEETPVRKVGELAWQDLTFGDERSLDAYSLWQVQVALLAKGGGAIGPHSRGG